jgi:hypothetical protein
MDTGRDLACRDMRPVIVQYPQTITNTGLRSQSTECCMVFLVKVDSCLAVEKIRVYGIRTSIIVNNDF